MHNFNHSLTVKGQYSPSHFRGLNLTSGQVTLPPPWKSPAVPDTKVEICNGQKILQERQDNLFEPLL